MKIELQIDEKYNERKIIIQAKEIDEEIKAILDKLDQIIKNSCKKDEQETEQEVEKELV